MILASAEDDEATQTVRASEQLRAFFQPLREPAPQWLSPPSPPIPVEWPAPSPAPLRHTELPEVLATAPTQRFMTGAAIAVPLQPGSPGVDLALRARWMATRVLGLGAMVTVPVIGSTVKSTEGSASVSALLCGAEIAAVLVDLQALRLSASGGLAVAWLRTSGFAVAPYVGHSDSVATSLPFLGLEAAPRLTDRLRVYVAGHAAVSLPRADIVFAGQTVATWGRPLGLLSVGLSVDL